MPKRLLHFFIIAAAHLTAILFDFEPVEFFTKPLLVAVLLVYFWEETKNIDHPAKSLIIIALLASIAGDVLLIFDEDPEKGRLYFLAGLGSFLAAQICYTLAFRKIKTTAPEQLSLNYRAILLPILFFALIMYLIWPGLSGELQIPVVIYALAITTMVSFAMQLNGVVKPKPFQLIFTGALLFMISDSLIALGKFTDKLNSLWNPDFLVMLTYILAQGAIVVGLVKVLKPTKGK